MIYKLYIICKSKYNYNNVYANSTLTDRKKVKNVICVCVIMYAVCLK